MSPRTGLSAKLTEPLQVASRVTSTVTQRPPRAAAVRTVPPATRGAVAYVLPSLQDAGATALTRRPELDEWAKTARRTVRGAANGGSSKRTNEVRAGDVSARRRVTEPNEERGWEAST